jgi:hypothetical protein
MHRLSTDKYISVLDDNFWPVVVRHFSDRPWIFQEDNAPCHVSLRANQWKEENGICTLLWPPQSPDLNIIKNVKCLTTTGKRLSSKTEIHLSVFMLPSIATKVPTP